MQRDEFVRIRTDALIGFHTNVDFDPSVYMKAVEQFYPEGAELEKADEMLMGMFPAMEQGPYRMRDLDQPSSIANLNLPSGGYEDYIAGQRRFSTSYAEDWPQAHDENSFGKRHPLSWDNCVAPILHGSQWGNPAFVDHLFEMIEKDENGQTMLHAMQEMERRGIVPREYRKLLGHPSESLLDLYQHDRQSRFPYMSDEEYRLSKAREWGSTTFEDGAVVKNSSRLGLLSFLFGLEWLSPEQRDGFMDTLKEMGKTNDPESPEAKRLANMMKAKAGISWDRARRNWFERTVPMTRWWERPSDRHGPVSPDPNEGLHHFTSPYVRDENNAITPSHTSHYWNPYQWWGGVGRDARSLRSMLEDSYPAAFKGWLGDQLMSFMTNDEHPLNNTEDSFHGSGSSHFPETANHPMVRMHPHRSSIATGWEAGSGHPRVRSFNRRRGLWSTVAHHQHLHPSEINDSHSSRMIVPSMELTMQPLGRMVASHSDMGSPRISSVRERHPGDEQFHTYHNEHYENMDRHLGATMQQMAKSLMERYGPDFLNPVGENANLVNQTLARGNMQQIAQAANYHLLRGQNPNMTTIAPMVMGDGMAQTQVNVGPVHPNSQATSPAVYLSGNTDAWGHEMPATLAWKWDNKEKAIRFDLKETPFRTLQRTAHAGHLNLIDPTHTSKPIAPKEKDAPALFSMNDMGHNSVVSGDLWKADDYEPTGVFETIIAPAHTIYKLSDLEELRGFSGDWVVQKKPEGKRLLVTRKGSTIKAHNSKGKEVKIPDLVKETLREQNGDFVLDVVMKGKEMRAIDLLVHRGEDIHMEPLEDRLQILRTMYHTDDNLSFPMPLDTKFTDHEGLSKQTDSIGGDVWIRDAKSTFAKGKKAHHLWVLFTPEGDGLTKGTTLPFVVNEGGSIGLEYPGHAQPLVVKGQWDGSGLDIESIEPEGPLARHAAKQAIVWGPVAAHLIKTHQREVRPYPHAIPSRDSFVFNRAPLMEPDGKHSEVTGVMSRVKRHLMDRDEAQDKEGLIRDIKGLTEHMLEEFGEEFGVERTEDGRFTVNEAIDDDMVETKMGTTLSAISGSITGGGWNGLMDMHTAPRGPTSLVDDEGIPMFDPYETDDLPPEGPRQLRIRQVSGMGEEVEGDVEIDGPSATLRYPNKTRQEAKEEAEIETEIDDDQVPIP